MLLPVLPLTEPPLAAAACGEHTKFVEQGTGAQEYYGNRDAIYTFNDVAVSCQSVNRMSTFVRTASDYSSWVETGVSEDYPGVYHFWTEWQAYPLGTVVTYYDGQGHPAPDAYYSFEIHYVGSPGYFSAYWASGSNPNTASWHFLGTADRMSRNLGQAESEEAHIGTGDQNLDSVTSLQTQGSVGGSWALWTNLNCYASQNTMAGWYAHKVSNSSWINNQVSSNALC